jgi:hypothetical protein
MISSRSRLVRSTPACQGRPGPSGCRVARRRARRLGVQPGSPRVGAERITGRWLPRRRIRGACQFLGVLHELTCRTVAVRDLFKTPEEHEFDLAGSKLRRPVVRRGTVPRSSLIDRLARDDLGRSCRSARAGYGKTTQFAQWAGRYGPVVEWVSMDAGDNDPKVLSCSAISRRALDGVRPIGGRVSTRSGSPTSSCSARWCHG